MNMKVEEALNVWQAGDLGYKELCYRKCDVDRRIAQQDATIAQLDRNERQILVAYNKLGAEKASLRAACDSIADRMEAEDVSKWPDATRVTVMLTLGQIRNFLAALNQEQGK